MAKIIIHRKKDWSLKIGYSSISEVLVDGQRIGYVTGGETTEFDVAPGQHTLKIRKGWYGSRDFEKIHLSQNTIYVIASIVLMVICFQILNNASIIKGNKANGQKMHYILSNKLLTFVVTLGIIGIIFLLGNQLPEKYSKYLNNKTRIGAMSSNISNSWHYKFYYLDGTVYGQFTAKNDNAKLIYSGNIEEGTIVFQLYRADTLITTFQTNSTIDTLAGIFEKGGKYNIRATATKAKGRFDFKME